MNAPFVREQSNRLAIAIGKETGPNVEKQIETVYQRVLGRLPGEDEMRLARTFMNGQVELVRDRLRARLPIGVDEKCLPEGVDLAQIRAMADLSIAIFNSHEFVYVP
jgi:hypothetical protein